MAATAALGAATVVLPALYGMWLSLPEKTREQVVKTVILAPYTGMTQVIEAGRQAYRALQSSLATPETQTALQMSPQQALDQANILRTQLEIFTTTKGAQAATSRETTPQERAELIKLVRTMDADGTMSGPAADRIITSIPADLLPAGMESEAAEAAARLAGNYYTPDERAWAGAEAPSIPGAVAIPGAMPGAVPGATTLDPASIALMTSSLGISIASSMVATAGQAGHNDQGARAQCGLSTGGTILSNLLQAAAPLALSISMEKFGPLRSIMDNLFAGVWDSILNTPGLQAPVTPEGAPALSRALFFKAMQAGMSAHLVSVVAESVSPLKNLGLGYLAAFLGDMAGFAKIGGAMMSAIESQALVKPFGYFINSRVRSTLPPQPIIEEMYAKKEISQALFDNTMGYYGISEEWLNVYHHYIWRDPRLFEVVRLAEIAAPDPVPPDEAKVWLTNAGLPQGIGPDWWYWMKFGKGAYDPLDLPILVNVAKMAVSRREQTLYLTQVRRLYRDEFMPRPQAESLLKRGWEPKDPIAFRLEAMDLELDYERKTSYRDLTIMALSRGRLTLAEAERELKRLGLSDEAVKLSLVKAKLGLLPKATYEVGEAGALTVAAEVEE